MTQTLLLGIDGGGTRCRARLAAPSGRVLGEGIAGPANIRFGLEESFAAVFEAASQCLRVAGLEQTATARITACLALAGATEPGDLAAARRHPLPFRTAVITSDVHAACVGAHAGKDGGVVVVGTGTIGFAQLAGRYYRVGGWGFPVSDEGSGTWLGAEVLRGVLWAHDARIGWTPLLRDVFARFARDPHAIVALIGRARPKDYAALAPLVVAAAPSDPVAAALMRRAAAHVDALLAALAALGAGRLTLVGGLAAAIEPWLAADMRRRLAAPAGDALDGALMLARGAVVQAEPAPQGMV
jgi:glucosamine kinase